MDTAIHAHSTAKLLSQIDYLNSELDDREAEAHALQLALAASTAYGREQHRRALDAERDIALVRATRDSAIAELRARTAEVLALSARLNIANRGQI